MDRLNKEHAVADHILLLRRASRGKVILLIIGAVMTWGLWTTLQAGSQKVPAVDDKYATKLKELKAKWQIPADSPLTYQTEFWDIIQYLTEISLYEKQVPWLYQPGKLRQFFDEFNDQQQQYEHDRAAAYAIELKVPYLESPVPVNALDFADIWPFVLISLLAAAAIFGMRERVNAVVLSYLSANPDERNSTEGISIRSDFRVGTLSNFEEHGHPRFFYRSPLVLGPERLLVCALAVGTLYAVLEMESSYNPVLYHDMGSVLFDFLGAVWIFLILMCACLWLTWKYYSACLQKRIGSPVWGRFIYSFARVRNNIRSLRDNLIQRRPWLRAVALRSEAAIAFMALASVALPWIEQGHTRGFHLLLSQTAGPAQQVPGYIHPVSFYHIDPGVYSEFQFQLIVALAFVVIGVIMGLTPRREEEKNRWVRSVHKMQKVLGAATLLLGGNLLFHFVMLQDAASSMWFFPTVKVLLWQTDPIIATYTTSLIWSDPAIGFWIFLILCIILTALAFRPRSPALTRDLLSPPGTDDSPSPLMATR